MNPSFWTCPKCHRQVLKNLRSCRCGFRVTTQSASVRSRVTQPSAANARWTGWLVAAFVIPIIAMILLRRDESPPTTTMPVQAQQNGIQPYAEAAPVVAIDVRSASEPQNSSEPAAPEVSLADDVPDSKPQEENIIPEVLTAVVSVETRHGQGSGFFVDDRLILTNYHVVEGEQYPSVRLPNGESISARVQRVHPSYDLALLELEGHRVSHGNLQLGSMASIQVGQEVLVVGSPLGIESTVTRGIVSAVREFGGVKLLQTDAAINPGNSGGPLIDRAGQVIGITTLKHKLAESIGFAVAIDHGRELVSGGGLEPGDASRAETLSQIVNESLSAPRSMADYEARLDELVATLGPVAERWIDLWMNCSDVPYSSVTDTQGSMWGRSSGYVGNQWTGEIASEFVAQMHGTYSETSQTFGVIRRWNSACQLRYEEILSSVDTTLREYDAIYREYKAFAVDQGKLLQAIQRKLPIPEPTYTRRSR